MADQTTTTPPVNVPTSPRIPEFPRPLAREITPTYEKRSDELTHEQAFDQDFDNLENAAKQVTINPQATQTLDGYEISVKGTFIEKIIVRAIEQDMRFDAASGYDLEPRYEVTIYFASGTGDMGDELTISLEELYTRSFDEHVTIIKQRLLDANRISANSERNHRVLAAHREKQMDDGKVEHEVRSEGGDVKHAFGYDGLVELEVKSAIDAIKTVMELQKSKDKIAEVVDSR